MKTRRFWDWEIELVDASEVWAVDTTVVLVIASDFGKENDAKGFDQEGGCYGEGFPWSGFGLIDISLMVPLELISFVDGPFGTSRSMSRQSRCNRVGVGGACAR